VARRNAPAQANNIARRRIGDFNRPEGYYPTRQAITGANQKPASAPVSQQPSFLNRNIAKRDPLLQSKSDKEKRRLPKVRWQKRARRYAKRGSLAIVVVSVVIGGFLLTKSYIKLHQIFKGNSTASALQADVLPGRINILVLGIGGAGHDGPDLTDTMLVASIDPVNNKMTLLSIPRDLWVKMPNNYEGNYQKINAAYEAGKYSYLGQQNDSNNNQGAINAGFKTADQAVSRVLGVPISYNVLVDFQAFQQAVNSVNEVNINVPTELYDPTMAWQNNYNPILAQAGPQVMNGSKALLYVRSRETTSDFARTQRQRAVIIALKDKALSLGTLSNPLKISGLISAFGDNVRTDLSLSDAETLYGVVKKISNNNIQSIGLADAPNNYVTTGDINGLSVVKPTAGEFDYSQIQTYVRSAFEDGYIAKESANVMVLNGTTTSGTATREAALLKSYGYNVGTVADAPTQNYQKTVVVDLTGGKDKYTKQYLDQRFHTTAISHLLDNSIQPKGANFVIIIGEDEAISS
jgi:LCP family protein required for cell wall assembly